ncbi:hypothetical protein H4P12_15220 [Paracoccus sp. 11-3]|uniref:Uncharacterized protein n=1 Tax=Paracoccus amoyensis TaxID=2760093 RepID=A0A926GBL9_9RHOB|nr:hypothetical protein [Paracoccus amoyensis]MBC9248028.1 hypothetical protein [Paracoccus amoyensis]
MTPNFMTGLALASPTADMIPLMLDASAYSEVETNEFATVTIGTRQQAQGTIVRRYRDGSISINAGGRIVTGRPITQASTGRGWWSRISGRTAS